MLTKEYLKELTQVQTCYFKNNEEFAIAETKGGDVLFICKLKISNDLPLKNGVDFNLINSKISTGYIYTDVINNNLYKFQYLINSSQKNHNLLLTANSNTSNSYVSSDSFVGYNFLAKDFSLKYGINEPVIINISKKNDLLGLTRPISMSILINKRKDGIYFLALIVNEKNKTIANNFLLGIINKE